MIGKQYYYCMIKTKFIEVDGNIVLDVPYSIYSERIMKGNSDVTYSGRVKNDTVLAVVAFDLEHKAAVSLLSSVYVGDKWDDLKVKKDYTDSYTLKVKDIKKTKDKDGVDVEYTGLDKDEPQKFAEWCEFVETGGE